MPIQKWGRVLRFAPLIHLLSLEVKRDFLHLGAAYKVIMRWDGKVEGPQKLVLRNLSAHDVQKLEEMVAAVFRSRRGISAPFHYTIGSDVPKNLREEKDPVQDAGVPKGDPHRPY